MLCKPTRRKILKCNESSVLTEWMLFFQLLGKTVSKTTKKKPSTEVYGFCVLSWYSTPIITSPCDIIERFCYAFQGISAQIQFVTFNPVRQSTNCTENGFWVLLCNSWDAGMFLSMAYLNCVWNLVIEPLDGSFLEWVFSLVSCTEACAAGFPNIWSVWRKLPLLFLLCRQPQPGMEEGGNRIFPR